VTATAPFKDYFSDRAAGYARARPGYPPELFDFLAGLASRRRLAWDCATGSGQAASGLAAHFDRVIATDASVAQLANAARARNLGYAAARAEASGIAAGTADLVSVAQAIHWFEIDRFWEEVRRVASPGGAVAIWAYNLAQTDGEIERVLRRYYAEIVGPYWPPERRLIEERYRTIPFPFDEIEAPPIAITDRWDLDRLVGYLGTWSATKRFTEATGRDPIAQIRPELDAAWGDPARSRLFRWPLVIRAGRAAGRRGRP